MVQRKVNGSEDLRRHADDGEPKTERGGEIKDASKGGRRQTLCLLATRTCSPGGGRTAAPVLTAAAGLDLLNMHECLSRFPAARFTEDAALCDEH